MRIGLRVFRADLGGVRLGFRDDEGFGRGLLCFGLRVGCVSVRIGARHGLGLRDYLQLNGC